ncbi:MAG TPA: HEAT repeat domain-containing protein [Polyangiaceae bacterium]|nr:HEAT repeat domain-containing protein [Polyangiaceae bacterium]
MKRTVWTRALTVATGLALTAPSLLAKPKHQDKAKVEIVKLDVPALKKQLDGSEQDVIAALGTIGDSQNPAGVPLVNEVLARGGNEAILQEALKAAGKLKSPALSPSIAPYVQHRTPEIRRAAARALVKTKGPAAVTALEKGLRSEDGSVRGTSATGLGEIGSRESIKDLFNAFDHGVAEAAAAIGQLCTPAECEDFAQRTGKVTFDVMQTGFDQILFRPSSEIPDEEKIKLVGRMRELGTVEVGKYLADVGERWPKDWSKKVKQAIDSAAHAAAGGAKQ